MLTGLKNRNSFEIFCGQLRRKGTGFLCVYADANGLHELNNTYGHEAGDNMLRSVAKVMQGQFGSDNVYRIGGDEFVAFSLSTDGKQFCSRTEVIKKELSEMGYHLSIGCAGSENDQQTVDEIIKKAEAAMFKDKASYYLSGGKDRRHR